jgi:CHAD domain-containing protein
MAKAYVHFSNKKIQTIDKFSGLGLKFKANLASLQKNAGNEAALYQLRVCLKKTLSLTEFLCNAPIDNIDPERHYKKFKILQKKISKTRDFQVQAKLLQKYRKPSGKAEAIFFQWLNLNRARKTKELQVILKKEKAANYLAIYKEISESLNTDNKEIILFTKEYIYDQSLLAEVYCQHIKRDFHKLRVIVKKLHFTMDLHGILPEALLYKIKQVEKLLGNAHDLTLGRETIKLFLKMHKISQASEKSIKKMSATMLKKINSDLKKANTKGVNLLKEIKEVNQAFEN